MNMLQYSTLLGLLDVGMLKRGSKQLKCVCRANMLANMLADMLATQRKNCWQGYCSCRADMSLADMLVLCRWDWDVGVLK